MKTPETNQQDGGLPLPASDIFAFVGVRRIIGDPTGKLMQDEVADRIQKLVNVLRETVGVMDAMRVLQGIPMSPLEKKAVGISYEQIKEILERAMPEYDAVCKAIHDANVDVEAPAAQDSDSKKDADGGLPLTPCSLRVFARGAGVEGSRFQCLQSGCKTASPLELRYPQNPEPNTPNEN